MLAWFRASLMTASFSSSSASNKPPLASKQLEYKMASSIFRNFASPHSNRLWPDCVPQMNRTDPNPKRSEEHTSELQSLMRITSAVFCLQQQNKTTKHTKN